MEKMHSWSRMTRAADQDMAMQVNLLRHVIQRYGDDLASYLPGSGERVAETLRPGQYRLFDDSALVSRLENAKHKSDRLLESALQKARKAGAIRQMAQAPSAAALTTLSADFPHFEPVIELLRQRSVLAQVTPGKVFNLPPILLVGAGGVGKTAFAEAVARCLSLPTRRVDMATSTASFVLAGSHSSWSSARPGAIWSLLHESESSGVMLIDEVDKAADSNHPPLGPLYMLLEPSSARVFMDEYVEVEINASHLIWIATCNDAEKIEPALRSRFHEFVVEAPTEAQMPAIAQSVYRERRKHGAWGAVFPEQIDHQVAQSMSACTPRQLSALIDAAVAHAASCRRTYITVEDVAAVQRTQQRQGRPTRRLGFL